MSQSVKTTLDLDVRIASHAASVHVLLHVLQGMNELIVFFQTNFSCRTAPHTTDMSKNSKDRLRDSSLYVITRDQ